MLAQHIKICTRGKTPNEFASDLALAISEVQMLLLERRVLDLDEAQAYSLFQLADLQNQLIKSGGGK